MSRNESSDTYGAPSWGGTDKATTPGRRWNMKLFEEYLLSVRCSAKALRFGRRSAGSALIDAMQGEIFHLHGILKVGIGVSALQGLNPVGYPSIRQNRPHALITRAFCGRAVPVKTLFAAVALLRLPQILFRISRLRDKRGVEAIAVGRARVGSYIYDACYLPRIKGVPIRQRLKIGYLLFCHYVDRLVIRLYHVELVVIGDPAYRSGMLFELCRALGVKCINAVSVDSFQMHKYFSASEFGRHYRDIPASLLDAMGESPAVAVRLENYLNRRFSGKLEQHDAMRAFAEGKSRLSRKGFDARYGLRNGAPLVFVMAHVLSDAPHAYAPTLYVDYEEWVVATVRALARNSRVNFLVKEHPSVELYGEVGVLRALLEAEGLGDRLLDSNVNTTSVIDSADAVITCGGTIGIEAAAMGIPAVLAGRPPYAGKGFTHEPESIADYEGLLSAGIESLPRLSPDRVAKARKVAYAMFELFDNDAMSLELGGVPYLRGRQFDESAFFRNVIEENRTPLRSQRIFGLLEEFDSSRDCSIINRAKLRSLQEGG